MSQVSAPMGDTWTFQLCSSNATCLLNLAICLLWMGRQTRCTVGRCKVFHVMICDVYIEASQPAHPVCLFCPGPLSDLSRR